MITTFEVKQEYELNCPPVLFVIFNRPDLTYRVFERIKKARPNQLFIAADGWRSDKPGEEQLCKKARSIVDKVDWSCELYTLFQEENLGCKFGPLAAINWFFKHVEEGIVLEDDCLPDLTFFKYCEELLSYYQNNLKILTISGFNYGYITDCHISYSFSQFMNPVGWATWRRSALIIDYNLKEWSKINKNWFLYSRLRSSMVDFDWKWVKNWRSTYDDLTEKNVDAWDYYWIYAGLKNRKYSVVPHRNLIKNIGFNESATHTRDPEHPISKVGTSSIELPLTHPDSISRNVDYEEQYIKKLWHTYYRKNFLYQLWAFYDDVIKP